MQRWSVIPQEDRTTRETNGGYSGTGSESKRLPTGIVSRPSIAFAGGRYAKGGMDVAPLAPPSPSGESGAQRVTGHSPLRRLDHCDGEAA